MTDYRTGSAQSPTPPQTDLRGTLFTEKRTDGGSSSSLMAAPWRGIMWMMPCRAREFTLMKMEEFSRARM
ncbi:SETD7 isoform 6 [Pan troglodytes]|uniref:SETD7 isoform 6 n=1 Tax=Pan troglodytes TaxID=9598 RepID=A0A2J8L6V5_PANTR|nr:SETD7 isoform 6 [Pan troglodytes]